MPKAASGMVPNISTRELLEEAQRELALFRAGLTNNVHLLAVAWGMMLRERREAVEMTMEIEHLDMSDACDAVWDSLTPEQRAAYLADATIVHEGMIAFHAP